MKLRLKLKVSDLPFLILFAYAVSLAPFLDSAFRNFFLILFAPTSLLIIAAKRVRFTNDLPLLAGALLYPFLVVISSESMGNLVTIAYTVIFASGYLALASTLNLEQVTAVRVKNFLAWLIKLFAIVSVIQLLSSMAGLPVLNVLATRGIWNHNSLATEPSNVGRIISLCMLVYLILLRFDDNGRKFTQVIWNNKLLLAAFVTVILLSGSALAMAAAPLAVLSAFRMRWGLILLCVVVVLWPLLSEIENQSVRRMLLFIEASEGLDLMRMAQQDTSGTVRVGPLIIWLDTLDPQGWAFWLGGGLDSMNFFRGLIPGVEDTLTVGFLPGYWMAFGFAGTILFLWVFVFRFTNLRTLPVVLLLLIFFFTAGWNTQVFWFGLLLLRVCYKFAGSRSSVPSGITTLSPVPRGAEGALARDVNRP
ncbi:hypothetical protein [Kordiimonas sp.]|uniref:hypothetical protein n=1 Tax=Kordiimonas sp. TaxID=1970157 RepID=UPI003A919DBC